MSLIVSLHGFSFPLSAFDRPPPRPYTRPFPAGKCASYHPACFVIIEFHLIGVHSAMRWCGGKSSRLTGWTTSRRCGLPETQQLEIGDFHPSFDALGNDTTNSHSPVSPPFISVLTLLIHRLLYPQARYLEPRPRCFRCWVRITLLAGGLDGFRIDRSVWGLQAFGP